MGTWRRPTSVSDDGYWANPSYAIDGNTNNRASKPIAAGNWTYFIELSMAATYRCTTVKIYAYYYSDHINTADIDVWDVDASAWVAAFDGAHGSTVGLQWFEVAFACGVKRVSKVRLRFKNNGGSVQSAYLGDVLLYEEPNEAPTAPTSLLCEGAASPQSVTDLTPEFSAIYNDPDSGDTATHFEVEVNALENFTGTVMWDSGWIDIADITEGDRNADVSYAGTALAKNGIKYYWRCRYKDDDGDEGAWSSTSNFRMNCLLTESLSVADTIEKAISRSLTESLGISSTMGKAVDLNKQEILALTDGLAFQKAFVRTLLETLSLSDADIEDILITFSENLALADEVSKAVHLLLDLETLALSDTVTKAIGIQCLETLSLSDQIGTILALNRTLTETLSISDTRKADIAKTLTETLPLADAVAKAVGKALAEQIDLADSFSRTVAFVKSLSETLGLSDGEAQDLVIRLTEALALGDDRNVALQRALSEALTLADAVHLGPKIVLTDTVALADSIQKAVGPLLTEDLALADALGKTLGITRILTELLTIQDRLRLGDVWDDPTSKVWTAVLKAAVQTQIVDAGSETQVTKGEAEAQVMKGESETQVVKGDSETQVV